MTDRFIDMTACLRVHCPLCRASRAPLRAGVQIGAAVCAALMVGLAFAPFPEGDQRGGGRSAAVSNRADVLLAQSTRSSPNESAATTGDVDSVDCFYASNRDDPLCSELIRTTPASVRSPAPPDPGEGVDCFYAENRGDPMCRDVGSQHAKRGADETIA